MPDHDVPADDLPGPIPPARFSPLHELHVAAGAAFTDFGGWQMPVRYDSDLAEHHAVRTAAGLFDISHMAEILVSGPDAAAYLDHALAGRLSALAIWEAKYTLLLAESGGIVDDLIVYRLAEERFLVVANAGNRAPVVAALAERVADFDVEVDDQSDEISLLAVQGPRAAEIVAVTEGLQAPLDGLGYYRAAEGAFDGEPLIVARTGYTGEDGVELYVDAPRAAELWRRIVAAGESRGLALCGLAARDTLRLEAGMPLYGHELSLDVLPVQAGLGRVVALASKGDFVGRAAVEAGPSAGSRVLVGLAAEGRRAGRAGYPVVGPDGAVVGEVTSGALSPTLGHPIAMAYVDPSSSEVGTALGLDVRGTVIPATVVALPFYSRPRA